MELVESLEYINYQLVKLYGNEPYADDRPRFRVVFSEDEMEKRWMTHTNDGFELLNPEVREVPKYRHYIKAKYILERLVPVDERNTDLTTRISYEPAHVFMRPNGEYLPPRLDMCCVVADSLLRASGRKPGVKKYNDPDIDPEYRNEQVNRMVKELFGNETEAMDAVHYGEGIINPAGQIEYHESQQKNSVVEEKTAEKVD